MIHFYIAHDNSRIFLITTKGLLYGKGIYSVFLIKDLGACFPMQAVETMDIYVKQRQKYSSIDT